MNLQLSIGDLVIVGTDSSDTGAENFPGKGQGMRSRIKRLLGTMGFMALYHD